MVVVELRCPDCMTWLKAPHTRADMRELDRRQAEYRAEIVAQYERLVTESMEALAACWGRALELDLLGADDFAVTPVRGGRSAPKLKSRMPPMATNAPAMMAITLLKMPVPPGVTT